MSFGVKEAKKFEKVRKIVWLFAKEEIEIERKKQQKEDWEREWITIWKYLRERERESNVHARRWYIQYMQEIMTFECKIFHGGKFYLKSWAHHSVVFNLNF